MLLFHPWGESGVSGWVPEYRSFACDGLSWFHVWSMAGLLLEQGRRAALPAGVWGPGAIVSEVQHFRAVSLSSGSCAAGV